MLPTEQPCTCMARRPSRPDSEACVRIRSSRQRSPPPSLWRHRWDHSAIGGFIGQQLAPHFPTIRTCERATTTASFYTEAVRERLPTIPGLVPALRPSASGVGATMRWPRTEDEDNRTGTCITHTNARARLQCNAVQGGGKVVDMESRHIGGLAAPLLQFGPKAPITIKDRRCVRPSKHERRTGPQNVCGLRPCGTAKLLSQWSNDAPVYNPSQRTQVAGLPCVLWLQRRDHQLDEGYTPVVLWLPKHINSAATNCPGARTAQAITLPSRPSTLSASGPQ